MVQVQLPLFTAGHLVLACVGDIKIQLDAAELLVAQTPLRTVSSDAKVISGVRMTHVRITGATLMRNASLTVRHTPMSVLVRMDTLEMGLAARNILPQTTAKKETPVCVPVNV